MQIEFELGFSAHILHGQLEMGNPVHNLFSLFLNHILYIMSLVHDLFSLFLNLVPDIVSLIHVLFSLILNLVHYIIVLVLEPSSLSLFATTMDNFRWICEALLKVVHFCMIAGQNFHGCPEGAVFAI